MSHCDFHRRREKLLKVGRVLLLTLCPSVSYNAASTGAHTHTQTHTHTHTQVVYDKGPVVGFQWDDFDTVRARLMSEWEVTPLTADNLSPSLQAKVSRAGGSGVCQPYNWHTTDPVAEGIGRCPLKFRNIHPPQPSTAIKLGFLKREM